MISLALSTIRGRLAAFVGAFIALLCSAVLLSASAYLAESGLHPITQVQRYAHVDAVVVGNQTMRIPGTDAFSSVRLPQVVRVPRSLASEISALPSVDVAVMDDRITVRVAGEKTDDSEGLEARRWSTATFGGFHVVEGKEPESEREMVLTVHEARRLGIGLGESVTASVDGVPQEYSVVGFATTNAVDDVATAFLSDSEADSLVHDEYAGDVLLLQASDGVDESRVEAEVREVLPEGFVIGFGRQVADAEHQDVQFAQSLLLLLASSFGGMAVLVTFFIISSMMALVLGSRRREFATLRTLGAMPRQLVFMVLIEVGLVSSAAGVVGAFLGIWVGSLLRTAFVTMGVIPSSLQLVVTPWAGFAGVAAVMLCACLASSLITYGMVSMSPVAALRDAAPVSRPVRPWRAVVAGIAFILGAAAMVTPLFFHDDIGAAGTGSAALVFVIATACAGPFLLNPTVRLVSAPIRRMGASGFLAAESARADCRRLGGVVIPLVLAVGFTLSMFYSQSTLARAVAMQVQHGVTAEVVVAGIGGDAIDAHVASAVRDIPEVNTVVGVSDTKVFVPISLFDDVEVTELNTSVISGEGAEEVLDPDVVAGSLSELKNDAIAIDRSVSVRLRREVGDVIDLRLGDGAPTQLRVVAVYQRGLGLGQALVPENAAPEHVPAPTRLLVAGSEHTSPEQLSEKMSSALARFPALATTDGANFAAAARAEATMASWVNLFGLVVIMGYVIIAVINSLVVATNVRRRELALLRLVGATRGQVLRAMRWEALLVVLCAVVLGTIIGGVPLVIQAIGFLGSVVPAGSPWIYVAVVSCAVVVGVLSVMVPVRLALRQSPITMIGQRE